MSIHQSPITQPPVPRGDDQAPDLDAHLFESDAERMTPQTHYHTEQFDDQLRQIPIYAQYPQLLPSVGSHASIHNILIVAESHYLPPKSHIHHDPQRWYASSITDLNQDERHWTHTRNILASGVHQRWPARGHTIYRHLEVAMLEAGMPPAANMFRWVTFMNAFQRPAQTGASLAITPEDVRVAKETLNQVIDILGITAVCIVSTAAYRALQPERGSRIQHLATTPHPACAWWHRESRAGSGKQRFQTFLQAACQPKELW